MNPIRELLKLAHNGVLSISKIEWWLLKYTNEYNRVDNIESSKHLHIGDDGTTVRLPITFIPNQNDKFLGLFRALNELTDFHKLENYFGTQMTKFNNIKLSRTEVESWLIKNKRFGTDKFVCFLIDYLDYDENDEEEHLSVFVHTATELDIFVDRADFKNTIEFLETFNRLYWTD